MPPFGTTLRTLQSTAPPGTGGGGAVDLTPVLDQLSALRVSVGTLSTKEQVAAFPGQVGTAITPLTAAAQQAAAGATTAATAATTAATTVSDRLPADTPARLAHLDQNVSSITAGGGSVDPAALAKSLLRQQQQSQEFHKPGFVAVALIPVNVTQWDGSPGYENYGVDAAGVVGSRSNVLPGTPPAGGGA